MRKTRDRVRAWKPHGLTKSTSNQLRFFQISSKVTKTSDKMQVVASNHRGDWYARRCTKIFRYLNPIPTRGKEEILPTIQAQSHLNFDHDQIPELQEKSLPQSYRAKPRFLIINLKNYLQFLDSNMQNRSNTINHFIRPITLSRLQ